MDIIFKKMDDTFNSYDLLYKWCQNKFVYEWFEQRKLDYEEIKNKYEKKIKDNKQKLFLVYLNDIPIGFIQYYLSDYNYCNYKNIYEYDLFIGEELYLSKGYGTIIINKLNNYIFENECCNYIVLRPSKRNIRAINAYMKCGFNKIDEYLDRDTIGNKETIYVMLKKRRGKNEV